MHFNVIICTCIFFVAVVTMRCTYGPEQEYRQRVKKELASGVQYDSLFKGLYLGMTEKDFRDYCLKMHIKGEFHEGGIKNGSWVEWKLKDQMKYPAAINFYPVFTDNVITEMNAGIYYDNHLSFRKEHPLVRDSLLRDVLHLMDTWYGPGFIRIKSSDASGPDVYVKVNGNRRITVYDDFSSYIIDIWFVDLSARKEDDD